MTRPTLTMMTIIGSLGLLGCSWINPRSGFERDPMVMNHLARSNALAFDGQAKEPSNPSRKGPAWAADQKNRSGIHLASHAADFRWVMGRIAPSVRETGRLAVQFEDAQGEPREIPLEPHPSLTLVRPGDRVMVEGDLVPASEGGRQMRVRRVALVP